MAFGIHSRRVYLPDREVSATIIVEKHRVSDILVDGSGDKFDGPVEDVGDWVVFPGLVDTHVHINEPGRTLWEGFETASQAAAAGGITTLVDMPLNCTPVTTTPVALEEKIQACRDKLWVDCAFWGGVVPEHLDQLAQLAQAGVLGAKAFMCHSGIDDFPKSDADTLKEAMGYLKEANLPLLVHAELEDAALEVNGDARDYSTYLASRPAQWEIKAIELIIELSRATGCAVHIVHLSAAMALDVLERARSEGVPITVETCPHYLCLIAEDIPAGATHFKCAPPIRRADNRDLLWKGLAAGTIDFIVSDHSPCVPSLKCMERGDFMEAWGGIASLQLGLSSIWTEASRRGFTLQNLVHWLSTNPARFAGLEFKGSIEVGKDADFVAWDPDALRQVTPDSLLFRHKTTPYLNRELKGQVKRTWLRGMSVFDGDKTSGPHGHAILNKR
jgi:allantoinase